MAHNTGVYAYVNTVNGKKFLAATIEGGNFALARARLKHLLDKRPNCLNNAMRADFEKYGKKVFVFRIISRCPPTQCLHTLAHSYRWHNHDYNTVDDRRLVRSGLQF